MMDSYLRPFVQKGAIDPLALYISNKKIVTPNLLSLLAGMSGILSAVSITCQYIYLAIFLLFFSALFDLLDGSVARLQGKTSPKGAFIDVFLDRLVEGSLVLGLYGYAPQERAFVCLLMMFSILLCITSFLLVGIFTSNATVKSFHYSPGLMERSEAFIFFALLILYPSFFTFLGAIFAAAVSFTAFVRARQFFET